MVDVPLYHVSLRKKSIQECGPFFPQLLLGLPSPKTTLWEQQALFHSKNHHVPRNTWMSQEVSKGLVSGL